MSFQIWKANTGLQRGFFDMCTSFFFLLLSHSLLYVILILSSYCFKYSLKIVIFFNFFCVYLSCFNSSSSSPLHSSRESMPFSKNCMHNEMGFSLKSDILILSYFFIHWYPIALTQWSSREELCISECRYNAKLKWILDFYYPPTKCLNFHAIFTLN